jgi:hypothetical protein
MLIPDENTQNLNFHTEHRPGAAWLALAVIAGL